MEVDEIGVGLPRLRTYLGSARLTGSLLEKILPSNEVGQNDSGTNLMYLEIQIGGEVGILDNILVKYLELISY